MPEKNKKNKEQNSPTENPPRSGVGFWQRSWWFIAAVAGAALLFLSLGAVVLQHRDAIFRLPGGVSIQMGPPAASAPGEKPSVVPSPATKPTPSVTPRPAATAVRLPMLPAGSGAVKTIPVSDSQVPIVPAPASQQPSWPSRHDSGEKGPHPGPVPEVPPDDVPPPPKAAEVQLKIASAESNTPFCKELFHRMKEIERQGPYRFVPETESEATLNCDEQDSWVELGIWSRRNPGRELWSSGMPKKRRGDEFYLNPGEASSYFFDSLMRFFDRLKSKRIEREP